ncbi:ribosomal RNA large subunit methyltransferase N [Monoraphidium neglectum]|uniref:Ribosomal RNA large subunit methyltransferase N n=1 Tax=Monoraphidium neglectum TaxID=145388 RepID=A0A0D2M081_9CHLO|nr:ribosomal RNA large subunit methyltransferase N [Monoraphidium neglectum]KIY97054.1 ribosomal RNA large subunit methyltransferase N [Monoraphidium neglectum]|eukprot:XP_013896074.1 ribosomal RNA large subunit methyltransferase N [Monoraphidium neglectum]
MADDRPAMHGNSILEALQQLPHAQAHQRLARHASTAGAASSAARRGAPALVPAAAFAAAGPAAAATQQAAIMPTVPAPPLTFAGRPGLYDESGLLRLKNLTYDELTEWCESIGEAPKRAQQLWRLMYVEKHWARSWADGAGGPDALSKAFQAKAAAAATLHGGLTLQSVQTAPDGTHKLVFTLHGGDGAASGNVETVLIPMTNRDGTQPRYTACLSTQVVEQVVEARRWLAQQQQQQKQQQRQQQQQQQLEEEGREDERRRLGERVGSGGLASASGGDGVPDDADGGGRRRKGVRGSWAAAPARISNIVFMGMGEPLANLPAVMPALDILCSPAGLALSKSKVIVSTVGLVPQLRELHASGKAKVAVSLHATTDEVRSWIAPVNRKHDLAELMGALAEMFPRSLATTPGKSDHFVCIEYVMLAVSRWAAGRVRGGG